MRPLVLWDVDHTLIDNAGVSKEIYSAAFERLKGRPPRQPPVTEGRTDPDIMAELLDSNHAAQFPWETVRSALQLAGAAHRAALAERGWVLPGVLDLVTALSQEGAIQTLVTGNIRENAEVKLAAFGLLDRLDLDVGGYGSDSRERSQLVALAKERTARKYGAGALGDTIVIGDTPRDVEAAREGGARMLAVASGIHPVDTLRAAGATFVVPDLFDTNGAVRFIFASDASGH